MKIHEHPHYSFKRALLIYALAVLFLFYEMGLQVSPSVMAFQLMRNFQIDAAGLGIMAGFYFYSYSFMQVPAGLLYDRYGARLLITIAVLVCAIGALFFGNTTTVFWATFGRLLMGFGSAFAFTGVLIIAALWFHPHRFALLVGIAQLFASLGAMGGAFPLSIAVCSFGWRQVIVALGLIGLILTLLCWLIIRDHPEEKCSPNIFKTPKIFESLKEVFSKSQNWWIVLYAFTSWAPIATFAALWGVPFLVTRFSISNQLAASAVSAVWIGLAVISPFIGWLSDRFQNRTRIMRITSLIGIAASLYSLYAINTPFWSLYISLFFFGIASAGQILTFALIKDQNRPTVIATALGFTNMAVVLGGAIFQPLVGLILRALWTGIYLDGAPQYTSYEYNIALSIIPFCYLIGFAVSVFCIKETHCKPSY